MDYQIPRPFIGFIEKIVIETEDSNFCPPEPGQEIRGIMISPVARCVLEMDELWMFDGGNHLTGDR